MRRRAHDPLTEKEPEVLKDHFGAVLEAGGDSEDEEHQPLVSPFLEEDFRGERLAHLVQDNALIEQIHSDEHPLEEYYEELESILRKKFKGADP